MGIIIINKEQLSEIPFKGDSISNGASSPLIDFVFEINVPISSNTSVFLSIERDEEAVFFINRNNKLTRQLNFYQLSGGGNTFHRKIKLYTHLPISDINNMPFMLFLKLPTPNTTWQDFTTCFIKTN